MSLAAPASKPMWPAVLRLLRLRALLTINTFRHSRPRAKIAMTVGVLGLLALAGGVFFISSLLLRFLRSPELGRYVPFDTGPLLQAMPELLLTGLFFGVMFTSFGVLLQALYLAGDMDFLLSSPVPMRAVFITKLTQAVLPNLGFFGLFGLPILYGLGASSGYNFLYYPMVLIVMAALTLAAAGISALLVMAVVRVLRPRRAAEILGFIGATAGVICSQITNLSETFGQHNGVTRSLTGDALTLAMRLRTPWVPLNWAGQGLVAIGEGRWLSGAALIAVTLGLTALVFWFALVTAERLYYNGWAGMQVVARKAKPRGTARSASGSEAEGLSALGRLLPGPVRGILVKDFMLLGRDLRNLSQLLSPLIIGIALSLTFLRNGGEAAYGRGEAPQWFMESIRTLSGYGGVAVALFVGWMLLSRLSGMAFSREGKNYWLLKASPVSPRQMLAAKFLGAYLPTLGLGYLLVIGIGLFRQIPAVEFFYMAFVVTFCLAGLCGILMAFGTYGAKFDWDDPRRMNAGGLGCVGQVATIIVLPISLGLFAAPFILALALQYPPAYGYLAGVLLGVAGNMIFAFLPLRLIEGKVQRLDES